MRSSPHLSVLIFFVILLSPVRGSSSTTDTPTEGSSSTTDTPTDGSSSTTDTPTDGSSSTTETPTDGSSSTTETPTDGSSSTTETQADGSSSTTETPADGSSSTTETPTDGSSTTTDTPADSSSSTTDTPASGTTSTAETPADGSSSTAHTTPSGTDSTADTATSGTDSTADTATEATGSTSEPTEATTSTTEIPTDGSSVTELTGSTSETSSAEITSETSTTGSTQGTQTEDSTGFTVDSTQDVTESTSAVTTTTNQTPTTKKYKYPTSPPKLDGAVYVLDIDVTFFGNTNIATEKTTLIVAKFNISFTGKVTEFKEIKVLSVGKPATATSETTPVKIQVLFTAYAMMDITNTTAFKNNVADVMEEVKAHPVGVKFTIENYTALLDALVDSIRDVCAAKGDICPAVLEVCSTPDQLCVHRCEYKDCGGNGQCTVVHGNENIITEEPEAKCQCIQHDDSLYERSGDNCDIESMKWQYVLAVSGGVGGTIILILIVLIACYCYRRSSKYKDHLESDDDDVYLHDFHRARALRPSDNLVDIPRANQEIYALSRMMRLGYQEDDMYRYGETPPGMSFLHAHDAQTVIEKQERALQTFGPGLGAIDHETRFSIKRPQIGQ